MTIAFKAKHPEDKKPITFSVDGPDVNWIMDYVQSRYAGYDIQEATIV